MALPLSLLWGGAVPFLEVLLAITYRGERFEGYNKPKRTPKHPEKSHAVLAKEGDKVRLIRFGLQGAENKPPRKGESEADKAKRRSFKARFAKQIAAGRKDKTASAAYWSDLVKW
jgi:hypothetical protein